MLSSYLLTRLFSPITDHQIERHYSRMTTTRMMNEDEAGILRSFLRTMRCSNSTTEMVPYLYRRGVQFCFMSGDPVDLKTLLTCSEGRTFEDCNVTLANFVMSRSPNFVHGSIEKHLDWIIHNEWEFDYHEKPGISLARRIDMPFSLDISNSAKKSGVTQITLDKLRYIMSTQFIPRDLLFSVILCLYACNEIFYEAIEGCYASALISQ
eukprot:GHVH01008219.1.p1 GENE.GHVH01008219.1~~GHVH01008219.1.p1  ORF type:complete len:209 (-),score=23.61 GHVH01008219.1:66-692(-)